MKDEKLVNVIRQVQEGKESKYLVKDDDCVYYKDRIYVPSDDGLKKVILTEAHNSMYIMHPGGTKVYL